MGRIFGKSQWREEIRYNKKKALRAELQERGMSYATLEAFKKDMGRSASSLEEVERWRLSRVHMRTVQILLELRRLRAERVRRLQQITETIMDNLIKSNTY